ncbi:hypothetical protein GEN90_24690 [Vibrio parahaemolyticus]|nr:hypothetical protein [Vibrio parahaemolyticus]
MEPKKKNLGGRPPILPCDRATKNVTLTPRQVEAIESTITKEGVRWRDVVRQLVDDFIAREVGNDR